MSLMEGEEVVDPVCERTTSLSSYVSSFVSLLCFRLPWVSCRMPLPLFRVFCAKLTGRAWICAKIPVWTASKPRLATILHRICSKGAVQRQNQQNESVILFRAMVLPVHKPTESLNFVLGSLLRGIAFYGIPQHLLWFCSVFLASTPFLTPYFPFSFTPLLFSPFSHT